MSSLKSVAKNSFLYTLTSVLLRASSIFLFPIFSSYLNKVDYGILSITQSMGGILMIFASLEFPRALTRLIYNSNTSDLDYKNKLLSTILYSSIISSVVLVSILSLFGNTLLKPLLKDVPFYPYVLIYILSIPFTIIYNTSISYWRSNHLGEKVFLHDLAFFFSNTLLNLFFVVVLKNDIRGILIGTLLNALIFSIYLFISFFSKIKIVINKEIANQSLRYSLPFIPSIFAGMALESVDKFFLNSSLGASQSGIYYIAFTFSSIFSSAKESVIGALTPWLFGNIEKKNEKNLSNIFNKIFLLLGYIAVGISFFAKEVLMILSNNPDLIQSYKYVPMTVLALYIIFLGQLYGLKIQFYTKNLKFIVFTVLIGLIANILLCTVLVPKYGITGAAIARIVAFTIHVIALIYLSYLEPQKRDIYNAKYLFLTLTFFGLIILVPHFDAYIPYFIFFKVASIVGLGILVYLELSKTFDIKNYIIDFYLKIKNSIKSK